MKNQNSAQPQPAGKGLFIQNPGLNAATALHEELHPLSDPLVQTDLDFLITGWNITAEKIYSLAGTMGENIFTLVNLRFVEVCPERMKNQLCEKGSWKGEIIFHPYDGIEIHFHTTANYILDEKGKPVSIIITTHNITSEKIAEKKLAEAEDTYDTLVNTLLDGVLMLDAKGTITTCNKRAAEILGVPRERMLGKTPISHSWTVYRPDGRVFPDTELPAVVTLQTGFPQRNVRMKLQKPGGESLWICVSSQALIREGEFNPYGVVVSFSDITEVVKSEDALQKSNERFFYCLKLTSDAIWDINLETNEIYRSEAFYPLSGYSPFEIGPTMDWWFSKVHPDDRRRVRKKIDEHLKKGLERWEDEYRFQCADGTYKYLYDTGMIQYKSKKPVRLIGAIRDLTSQKKNEHQKSERDPQNNIQETIILAKSLLESATTNPERSGEMLHKAIECLSSIREKIRNPAK